MEITAAIAREANKPFAVEKIELDEKIRDDEVLVRVVAAGLCHTDVVCRDQYYPVPLPFVPGHEGAGVVEAVGKGVTKVVPGDHVVLTFNYCGTCSSCQEGDPGYCHNLFGFNFGCARPSDGSGTMSKNGEHINGYFFSQSSFGEHAIATERNIVKVRKDAPLELLGPLGCGIQTGAGGVMNSLHPRAGTSIAVFGAGGVGLSSIMAAVVVGCTTIISVDVKPGRLKLAKELGATHTIDASNTNPVEEIQKITGSGANYTLETTALPAVFRQCVDSLTLRGVCGVIGAAPLGTEVSLDVNSIMFGRTIRGIIEGDSVPDIFIPRMVDLFMQGRFPIDKMMKKYPLADIHDAVADSAKGTAIKPILMMS